MPSKKKKYNSRFPPARIKKIMQTDEEVGKVAAAVPVIISRALELFIESLIVKSADNTKSKNAKTLSAAHIKQTITSEKKFDFLKDLVANIPDVQQVEDESSEVVPDETKPGPSTVKQTPQKATETGAVPKKRGRPKKIRDGTEDKGKTPQKQKRSKPPKKVVVSEGEDSDDSDFEKKISDPDDSDMEEGETSQYSLLSQLAAAASKQPSIQPLEADNSQNLYMQPSSSMSFPPQSETQGSSSLFQSYQQQPSSSFSSDSMNIQGILPPPQQAIQTQSVLGVSPDLPQDSLEKSPQHHPLNNIHAANSQGIVSTGDKNQPCFSSKFTHSLQSPPAQSTTAANAAVITSPGLSGQDSYAGISKSDEDSPKHNTVPQFISSGNYYGTAGSSGFPKGEVENLLQKSPGNPLPMQSSKNGSEISSMNLSSDSFSLPEKKPENTTYPSKVYTALDAASHEIGSDKVSVIPGVSGCPQVKSNAWSTAESDNSKIKQKTRYYENSDVKPELYDKSKIGISLAQVPVQDNYDSAQDLGKKEMKPMIDNIKSECKTTFVDPKLLQPPNASSVPISSLSTVNNQSNYLLPSSAHSGALKVNTTLEANNVNNVPIWSPTKAGVLDLSVPKDVKIKQSADTIQNLPENTDTSKPVKNSTFSESNAIVKEKLKRGINNRQLKSLNDNQKNHNNITETDRNLEKTNANNKTVDRKPLDNGKSEKDPMSGVQPYLPGGLMPPGMMGYPQMMGMPYPVPGFSPYSMMPPFAGPNQFGMPSGMIAPPYGQYHPAAPPTASAGYYLPFPPHGFPVTSSTSAINSPHKSSANSSNKYSSS